MKSPILVLLTVLLSSSTSFLWNTNLVLAAMDDDEKATVAKKSISGKIESCSGWSLNKLPQLKKFLKLGHAESYQNVEIEYIHGRKATLTIYHDEKIVETVVLSDLKNHEEMHALFVEKGFQLKPENEIEAIKAERYAEHGKQIEMMEERARKRKTGVRQKKKPEQRKSKSNNNRSFNREDAKPLSDEEKAELRKQQEEYRQARKLEREQRRQNIKEGKSDDKEFFLKERRRKEREERRARGADQKTTHGELKGELKEKMIQKFRDKIAKMKLGKKERVGTDEL